MDFSKSKMRLFVMTQRLKDLDKNNINLLHSKENDFEEEEVQVKVIPNSIELPSVSQEEIDKAKSDVDNEKKITLESMNNSNSVVKGKNLKYIS